MKPDESPSPATPRPPRLRVVRPLPPKRRCKAQSEAVQPAGPERNIIYLPSHRPARIHRSAQPFQVWKEPQARRIGEPGVTHSGQAPAPKPEPAHGLRELIRAYSRTLAFLFSWRGLHHTP